MSQPFNQIFGGLWICFKELLSLLGRFFGNENSISILASAKGGGFIDYETKTCINAILQNLNLYSTKPPPKMSLGISQNDHFQVIC